MRLPRRRRQQPLDTTGPATIYARRTGAWASTEATLSGQQRWADLTRPGREAMNEPTTALPILAPLMTVGAAWRTTGRLS